MLKIRSPYTKEPRLLKTCVARGNKLSSCKIPDQYLKKKKKIIKLLELWLLWLKRKEKQKKKIANTKELLLQCYHAIMLSYLRPFPIDFS